MNDIIPHDPRHLPLYLDGLDIGILVGLRLALTAIDDERSRQQPTPDSSGSPSTACREYADGRLLAVMRVLGGRFRQ